MRPSDEREQLDRVRQRFTRSAEGFAKFALSVRLEEAQRLARLAAARATDLTLDLACGPGTFAFGFAPLVKFVCGLDLTPAILEQAQRAMRAEGVKNVALVCGSAFALPYREATFDLATGGYCLHHMPNPGVALGELARVLRPRGRVALVDLIVPQGADPDAHNAIERARDDSHASTLTAQEFRRLLEDADFQIRASEQIERVRSFDDWMRIAGCEPGHSAWLETWRLMEASIPGDAAGFHPRLLAGKGREAADIEFVQTALFIVGEKLES